jgi:hypothetical protein
MKPVKRLLSNSEQPLILLYEQGIAWEELRAAYWSLRGDAVQMMDAQRRAAHYQAQWESLPETAHRFLPPTGGKQL